jgi:hypothetical protein
MHESWEDNISEEELWAKVNIEERDLRTLRRNISKNHKLLQHRWTAAELIIYLEDPVSTKTVRRELHKSNIHGMAANATRLITESNAQMRHDHETWTSDNVKCLRDMVRWVILHAVRYIRKNLRSENTQGRLQFVMPGSNNKIGEPSVMIWAAISWYSILLVPLLPFMAELL